MKPLSLDLRQRVIHAREAEQQTLGRIAQRFALPKASVQTLLAHYHATGQIAPKPRNAGRKPVFQGEAARRLEADVLAHPDATLAELRDRSGFPVALTVVHRALRKMGFTRKKNRYRRASRNGQT